MIKNNILIICISALFLIFACEDSINYKSDYKEEAILYCIINADEQSQSALIKNNYDNENEAADDNYISNALITLSSDKQLLNLDKKEGDGIISPKHYYSTNSFSASYGSEITINALLSDNTELNSTIKLPEFSLFFFDRYLLDIPFTRDSKSYIVRWTLKNPTGNYTFLPSLFFNYSILENNVEVIKRIEIPIDHVYQNEKFFPIFPQVTENSFQRFSQETMNIVLSNISEGDTNKSNYKILGGLLELYILEENLATYYSSTETFKNSFSVKVYENDISNINGGRGVFGAYIKRTLPIEINPGFIKSFGYTTN